MFKFTKVIIYIFTIIGILIPNKALLAQIEQALVSSLRVNGYWCSGEVTVRNLEPQKYLVTCQTTERIEIYTIRINQDGSIIITQGFER